MIVFQWPQGHHVRAICKETEKELNELTSMLLFKRQWKEKCLLVLPRQKYLDQSITEFFLMISSRVASSFAKTSASLKRSPFCQKKNRDVQILYMQEHNQTIYLFLFNTQRLVVTCWYCGLQTMTLKSGHLSTKTCIGSELTCCLLMRTKYP